MAEADDGSMDGLCKATADIGRHVAGLAEELASLLHPHAPASPSQDLVGRQVNRLRDQAALLSALIEDIGHRAA